MDVEEVINDVLSADEYPLLPEDPYLPATPSSDSSWSDRLSTIPETEPVEPINIHEILSDENAEHMYRIELDEEARKRIHCTLGRDMDFPYEYIGKDIIIYDISTNAELSPFFPFYAEIEGSETNYIWLHVDYESPGDVYLFCARPVREYEMKSSILNVTEKAVEKLEMLSDGPIELEQADKKEQLVMTQKCLYGVFNTEYDRQKNIILSSVEADELCGGYVCFESDESEKKKNTLEYSSCFEKQVDPCILTAKETQTKAYITNNKCIQKDDIIYERTDKRTNRKVLCTLRKYSELIYKSLSEYRNISVYEGILDQYRQHEKHLNEQRKSLTLMKPLQLADNWLFIKQSFKVIPHYMEFERISCIAWHPRYIDYVAIAYHGHINLGKDYFPNSDDMQEEYFEKIPQADYLIVVWKVTNEFLPTRIIISEFEIKCLTFNENYPSLLAGADHYGHIILWDLNNFFLPEKFFERKISTRFGDQYVPWKYIPPIITLDALILDMDSHEEPISDLQWFPKNCKIREDEEICEKVQSEKLVTGSDDGSVKIWIFQGTDKIQERLHKQHNHEYIGYSQQIDELLERNKCFLDGVEYILETVEDEQVPVTAVSCSKYRTTIKTYLQKTSSFSFSSLREGVDRQETISCNIITALCNGKLQVIHAEYTDESTDQEPIEVKDAAKNQKPDVRKKAYQFRHEGPAVCLRRCPYAMDLALSVSASSFCVWKEGTMKVHPVFWKRFLTDKEYTNGDWSSHKTASIILLTSSGIVEFWDLIEQDKTPLMTVRVGINTVEHVFPMTFTMKEDQLAFIERDLLYFAKIPHTWKKSTAPVGEHLQNIGSHEVSRRRKYYAWKLEYEENNREEIALKVWKFEEILRAVRMKKLLREFNRAKFEECLKYKTPCMEERSIYDCPRYRKFALDSMPKEEIELNVAMELQVKRALEIQEKHNIFLSHSLKMAAEDDELTEIMDDALDDYMIDEMHEGLSQSQKYFLKYLRPNRLSEKNPFKDLIEEIEAEYDSIDTTETKRHEEEVTDKDETDKTSKAEKSYCMEIEPYYAFANDFTDFYSWIRYLDLYNIFPASVLYDQHVNLMPRGNTTNFALECEAKFLTRLSKDTPEIDDGSK